LLALQISEGKSYAEIFQGIRQLSSVLTEEEITDLQNFLLLPVEVFGEMENLERLAVCNEVLNALVRQEQATDETAEFIAELVLNPEIDMGLRNYALQFTFALIEERNSHIQASEATYQRVREEAYRDLDSPLAGVAMLADVRAVRGKHTRVMPVESLEVEVKQKAKERLEDAANDFRAINYASSLNTLIELNDSEVDPWLSRVLEGRQTAPFGILLTAIRGAGERNLVQQQSALLELAQDEQEHEIIRNAAEAAVQKMQRDASGFGEDDV